MALTIGTTYSTGSAGVSSVSVSVTVANTAHNMLVAIVGMRAGGGQTISSVTFNGVSMTQGVFINDNGGLRNTAGGVYYLANADVTTANCTVTTSASCVGLFLHVIPFYGADTTIGATNSGYNGSTNSNTLSITTTTNNSYIVGGIVKSSGSTSGDTFTDGGSQTGWGNTEVGISPNISTAKAAYLSTPTAGSNSLSWSWTTAKENSSYGIEIKQFIQNYPITLAQGSFTLTGQNVILNYGRKVVLAAGSFTLTGYSMVMTLFKKWIRQTKNTSSLSNQSKNSSSWTDQSKNSSTWTDQTKN